jgi:hypothetical protein
VIDATRIGVGLLVGGVAAIAVESVLAAVWTARLSRKARALGRRLAEDQRMLESDVARLREAMAETVTLWQPYRRWLRYLRHPIVVAVLQSYLRRGMAAR